MENYDTNLKKNDTDNNNKKSETSKVNTLCKVIIWRILTLCITICILLIVMEDLEKAITTGLIDHSICLFCHYFYERLWVRWC